jgi:peroxiredoxin
MLFKSAMSFRFLIVLLFFIQQNIFAISKVSGVAINLPNKKITVVKQTDYFTNTKSFVTKTTTDSLGNFSFSLDTETINYFLLEVDNKTCGLYITDGTQYDIEIISEKNTKKATIIFYNLPPSDINFLITNCKNKTADFLAQHIDKQGTQSFKTIVRIFADSLLEAGKKTDNSYYKDYAFYHAGILEILGQTSNQYIYDKYIDSLKIDLNHSEFYNFIDAFYGNYFSSWSAKFDEQLLNKVLSSKNKYTALDTLLAKDVFLKNNLLRQLVAAKSISENFYNKNYNEENLKSILLDLSNLTQYKEIKNVSIAILALQDQNKKGMPCYNFCLQNIDHETICLNEMGNEKIILLEFTSANNLICQKEMGLMIGFYKKYNKEIEFITILLNDDEALNKKFLKENQAIHWTVLLGQDNFELKQNYHLSEFPTYFIIDKEKGLLVADASKPSEKLESIIKSIITSNALADPVIGGKN